MWKEGLDWGQYVEDKKIVDKFKVEKHQRDNNKPYRRKDG